MGTFCRPGSPGRQDGFLQRIEAGRDLEYLAKNLPTAKVCREIENTMQYLSEKEMLCVCEFARQRAYMTLRRRSVALVTTGEFMSYEEFVSRNFRGDGS